MMQLHRLVEDTVVREVFLKRDKHGRIAIRNGSQEVKADPFNYYHKEATEI